MPAKLLNTQNKTGETVLGWILKFVASGLLDKSTALKITQTVLKMGALPNLPSFEEKVRVSD